MALSKELIIFNNKLNKKASTTLVTHLNNRMSIKRKIALVRIYKYPICVKYNRTIYYKEDCWERNLENTLKNIGDKICIRKKQRITRLLI